MLQETLAASDKSFFHRHKMVRATQYFMFCLPCISV